MLEWINYINRAYINLAAPEIKIFKLDKAQTETTNVYGEEKGSRIYLPPFIIRALHFDNTWRQLLTNIPYTEQEDSIQFVVNFEDMVQKIRSLKNKHSADIYISYSGIGVPSAENLNNTFKLKVDGDTVFNVGLTESSYNTVEKLANSIANANNFSVDLSGNDSSVSLIQFNNTTFPGSKFHVYALDNTYQNATDIIEIGDLVLTNKWRLYEVATSVPSGDFGWDYVTWSLTGNLARLDQASLPQEYIEEIKERQWGIKDKLDME